jgi:hypothetical protein
MFVTYMHGIWEPMLDSIYGNRKINNPKTCYIKFTVCRIITGSFFVVVVAAAIVTYRPTQIPATKQFRVMHRAVSSNEGLC